LPEIREYEVVKPETSAELRTLVLETIAKDWANPELSVTVRRSDTSGTVAFRVRILQLPGDGTMRVSGQQKNGGSVTIDVSADVNKPAYLTLLEL
jgi:hypothetical protein